MAKSPLILAALAKDAAPHLDFTQVKPITTGSSGSFDSALLTATTGEHFVVKLPSNATASTEQATELRVLQALSPQSRASLPFEIPQVMGESRDLSGHRAMLFKFIYGDSTNPAQLAAGSRLADSVARSIAAIHSIERSVVENTGLPNLTISESLNLRVAELDRIAATGRVPAILLSRWEAALEDVSIFHYQNCVIHGGLSSDAVLSFDDEVTGVLNWASMRIGDPAEDLAWVFGTGLHENNDALLRSYLSYRSVVDHGFRARATLYSELEIGRWLLHGVNRSDTSIIEDAVSMLTVLSDDVRSGALSKLTATTAVTAAGYSTLIEPDQTLAEEVPTSAVDEMQVKPADAIFEDDLQTKPIELPEKSENELF